MCKNNSLSQITDSAKKAKEVFPKTIDTVDDALSTVLGMFSNIVFHPIKKANLIFNYKIKTFELELKNKYEQIPSECIHYPNLMIAGPTLEALKYTIGEEDLRKMFINLLASSADSRKDPMVHPYFVEIIKNLTPYEAKFLHYLKDYRKALVDFECNTVCGYNLISIPDEFDDAVKYINNFIRMGIFEKTLTIKESCFSEFEEVESLAFDEYSSIIEDEPIESLNIEEFKTKANFNYYWLQLTEFGEDFIDSCID